jgi:ribosome-associated protein YbcJ (S4-like RNA binding protein)
MKRLCIIGITGFLWNVATIHALATHFDSGSDKIVSQPVKGDLYIGAGTVTVNASIDGDLVAAGGRVYLNDSVSGDVLAAGGTVNINGVVGDDIRAAGGSIKIEKNVSGDVVVGGGEIEISPGVTIFGDLIITGGKAIVNGIIKGKVSLQGGEIFINGTLEQRLEVKGGKLYVNGTVKGPSTLAAETIFIQSNAKFYQDVSYWQEDGPVNFDSALVSAKASFNPDLQLNMDESRWYFMGFSSIVFLLLYMASVILLLFVFEYISPLYFQKAGNALEGDKVKLFGYGMLYLLGVPFVSIVLLITVIGIPVGLFGLVFYIFSVALTHVITALVTANWYNAKNHRQWSRQELVWSALAAFVIIKLISLFPVIGWLASLVFASMAFGAIIKSIREKQVPAMA